MHIAWTSCGKLRDGVEIDKLIADFELRKDNICQVCKDILVPSKDLLCLFRVLAYWIA